MATAPQDHISGPPAKSLIRAKAMELGFDTVGFAPATADPAWRRHLDQYVAEGRHGEMTWMAERMEQRASPQGLWPHVRAVVVLGSNYTPKGDALSLLAHPERGNISVYARGKDYHDVVKKRLKALARWMVDSLGGDLKVFVDTAPVMEKPIAAGSGVGWQGRHTNVVSRRFGSWLFLGEIYTSLALPADAAEPDHCGSCRACVTACPTGALDGHGRIEPRRCISYLTIEHKGAIAEELRPLLGNRIYGCDDCMAVCPWNKFSPATAEPEFFPRLEMQAPRLADLAGLDDASFRQVFAASPVKRIGRDRMMRNVLIAMGNSGDASVLPAAMRLLADNNPVVVDAAQWAIQRLSEG
ncbi:tRNA epoxyqueuosine(34) reductase QueG [Magnetospirillum sulfuroxidans]|uniref:tRNA epoxyqueuosine(34) reductase QueG n=1 Tax=Magnetospirillum sulfuroxidans TaxID=611300 RepID=UPI0031FF1045